MEMEDSSRTGRDVQSVTVVAKRHCERRLKRQETNRDQQTMSHCRRHILQFYPSFEPINVSTSLPRFSALFFHRILPLRARESLDEVVRVHLPVEARRVGLGSQSAVVDCRFDLLACLYIQGCTEGHNAGRQIQLGRWSRASSVAKDERLQGRACVQDHPQLTLDDTLHEDMTRGIERDGDVSEGADACCLTDQPLSNVLNDKVSCPESARRKVVVCCFPSMLQDLLAIQERASSSSRGVSLITSLTS